MGRRKNRRRHDEFGLYEMPVYRPAKRRKKKFTLRTAGRLCGILIFLCVLLYSIAFGIKYHMRDRALSLYQNGDYAGALPLLEEALHPPLLFAESMDNDVRLYIADCYVNMGKYADACDIYDVILSFNPRDPEKISYLQNIARGLQLYEEGDYRSALPILLAAYEDGYGELLLYVGSCYGQTGDLENMQIYYNIYLQNHEMNGFMYAQYAAIALDQDDLSGAYQYIEEGKALQDQTGARELLYDEIIYYEKQKEYNTAYEKAKAFTEAYPEDADGKAEYDILYTRQTISK